MTFCSSGCKCRCRCTRCNSCRRRRRTAALLPRATRPLVYSSVALLSTGLLKSIPTNLTVSYDPSALFGWCFRPRRFSKNTVALTGHHLRHNLWRFLSLASHYTFTKTLVADYCCHNGTAKVPLVDLTGCISIEMTTLNKIDITLSA